MKRLLLIFTRLWCKHKSEDIELISIIQDIKPSPYAILYNWTQQNMIYTQCIFRCKCSKKLECFNIML